MDLEKLKQEYPASRGWELVPLGNRIIAVNRWGGAQRLAHRKPLLPRGTIPIPESWGCRYRGR